MSKSDILRDIKAKKARRDHTLRPLVPLLLDFSVLSVPSCYNPCPSALAPPARSPWLDVSAFATAGREPHGSPHGSLLIDIVRFLSKSANSIFATALLNVFHQGFTGRILKIDNKIKGPHGFTGPITQGYTPSLICFCLFVRLCLWLGSRAFPPPPDTRHSSLFTVRSSKFNVWSLALAPPLPSVKNQRQFGSH